MSWRWVYNKIKKFLESESFKKENEKWNPNTPREAIKIALVKLVCDYYGVDEYKGYSKILKAIWEVL